MTYVPLLLFRTSSGVPMAVPLALVSRLEELERKTIERSNDRWVVQYRGQLMPLIPMSPEQDVKMAKDGRQPVLVFADREHAMGLMVDEIVDIVEAKLNVDLAAEFANMTKAKVDFRANVFALDASNKMIGSLFDILA